MDTRRKILPLEVARSVLRAAERDGQSVRLLTGYFDPLLAAHAQRVAKLRASDPQATLMVLVTDPDNPLLPAEARAELAASLAAVDYVVIGDELLAEPPSARVLRAEEADRDLTAGLVEHVRRKQSQAGGA